jgi:negative regulator of flagellin synthesis FlgM
MKINNFNRVTNNPYQKQLNKQAEVKQTQTKKMDQIEISSKALEMQKGEEVLAVRKEKVDSLKNQINSGSYQVNYDKVAEKFLEFWKNK